MIPNGGDNMHIVRALFLYDGDNTVVVRFLCTNDGDNMHAVRAPISELTLSTSIISHSWASLFRKS